MTSKEQNIEWLDSLRALAIVGVIIIHITTPVVKMSYGTNMLYWWIGNIIDSAVRFAVPVFLMLSGATMLDKSYNIGKFYKKRIIRVLVPFLFWMIVYWIFRWYSLPAQLKPYGFAHITDWAVNLFLTVGVSKHFWYIYMILFLYLFVPLFALFVRNMSSSMILFLLGAWVLLCYISNSLPINMYTWSGDYFSKIYGYFLYSGYMFLGFFIYKYTYVSRNIRLTCGILFFITILISGFVTYFDSQKDGKLNTAVYSYLNPNSMIQSFVIFLWLKNIIIRNKIMQHVQKIISNYSYGIYLVHILVIDVLFQHKILWTMAHPLLSLPLLFFLTLTASFFIIYILRKIPFGKYISG